MAKMSVVNYECVCSVHFTHEPIPSTVFVPPRSQQLLRPSIWPQGMGVSVVQLVQCPSPAHVPSAFPLRLRMCLTYSKCPPLGSFPSVGVLRLMPVPYYAKVPSWDVQIMGFLWPRALVEPHEWMPKGGPNLLGPPGHVVWRMREKVVPSTGGSWHSSPPIPSAYK